MPEGDLKNAINDYRFLLNRNYSQKASIKLVGDRYMLKREERSILYRGVSGEESARLRKSKLTELLSEKKIYIDTYNILFTIGNYLNGRPVFISDDGFLRDAGELRGRFTRKKLLLRIVDILKDFFLKYSRNEYNLFLDQPVSNSGELAVNFNQFFRQNDLRGKAETCESPDYEIVKYAMENDIVCSSDSVIIERVPCRVFDLSFFLINKHFDPDIIDLNGMIEI
ncbi:MAG: DUF434 domain-containing protein [Bacteroidota bacterium]